MPQHFLRALRAPEGRKKRDSPQNQGGVFNGLGGRILRPPFVFQLRERMAPAMPPPATPMARSLKYAVKGSCWPESSA